MIALQGSDSRTATTKMKAIKSSVQSAKRDVHLAEAEALFNQLPPAQQRLLECTREKGASSWVTCPLMSTVFFYTKEPLGMRYASDMDESYRICPSTVPVGALFQLTMPWFATRVAFQHYGTTKYAILLLTC